MKTPFLVAALSATALFGQTSGQSLEGRVEIFGEFSKPRQVVFGVANAPSEVHDQADSHYNGGGFRLMGELPGTQGWFYLLGGKLESSSKLTFNGPVTTGSSLDTTDVSIRHSYWAVGVSRLFDLGQGLTIGVHGEGRGEAISAVGEVFSVPSTGPNGAVNGSTTYFRPWVRASFDWTLRRPSMSPYFGCEVALPLIKTSQNRAISPLDLGTDSNALKSMAPGYSVGIYAGLRF